MSDYIIGLTGGIASGKSEVSHRYEVLGIAVADADIAARTALVPGSPGLADVVAVFGQQALDGQGGLDRAAMRRRVFSNDAARRQLEAIVHPLVRAMLHDECAAAAGPYAIAAIPLLAEGGGRESYPWLDRILVVDVPRAVQVARLLARDGIDLDLAERMLAAQVDRQARLAIADDVIVNDGPLETLDAQVAALDGKYRQLSANKAAS